MAGRRIGQAAGALHTCGHNSCSGTVGLAVDHTSWSRPGGFYSYTWLENLFRVEIRNADHVIPEFQSRKVGDVVWMTPEHRYGNKASMTVAQLVPNRAMVLVQRHEFDAAMRGDRVHDGIWQFLLEPISDSSTRLIMRGAPPDESDLVIGITDSTMSEVLLCIQLIRRTSKPSSPHIFDVRRLLFEFGFGVLATINPHG